ncbi:hypothetical protein [Nostoc linckia]|nr:hypothetical protein [Nostoc linckia]
MKVLCKCLPPAATALQGLESAEVLEQSDVSQSDSAVIQPAENLEFINSFNTAEIDSNKSSIKLQNSVHTNILQSNQFSSDQDFISLCSSGTSSKIDNQNLFKTEDNGLGVVSIPAAVPLEQPLQNPNNGLHGESVGEETADVSYRIEELKRVTKLRLMALTQAKAKVRQYCVITGHILSTQERDRLEQRTKMQFYLDSGNETLIAEANEWATANPACLPFSLELESEKFWER